MAAAKKPAKPKAEKPSKPEAKVPADEPKEQVVEPEDHSYHGHSHPNPP